MAFIDVSSNSIFMHRSHRSPYRPHQPSSERIKMPGNTNDTIPRQNLVLHHSPLITSFPPSLSAASITLSSSYNDVSDGSASSSLFPPEMPGGVALITVAALVIFVAAQSFINSMLRGDRGLGAFLSDGSGYNRSGFRSRRGAEEGDDGTAVAKDPLPWLKLPRLDFVEVAGQDDVGDASGGGGVESLNEGTEETTRRSLEEVARNDRIGRISDESGTWE
mmetsp:Transcript_3864/g.4990  ORF Transcript_3864/g.4990 Transcript_3864/m.4990 type:complete len:220 (-) Transcript_3864:83-742(-)